MRKGIAKKRFVIILCANIALVALLIVAPMLLGSNPNSTDLSSTYISPGSDGHLLGTDSAGRDVLARTLAGGRESVCLGFAVLAIVVSVGSIVGLLCGYIGGAVDYLANKVVTAFQAFPSFVLAIAIAGMLGQGMGNMVIAIAAVYWTQFARLTRSIAITFRGSDCMKAAQICGAGHFSILFKYLLPKIAGPLGVMAALSMSDIVLTMAGLSFIGLGPERPTNEWGTMMAEAQPSFQYAIWCMLVPMCALFICVVFFNLLADSLRDALDIKSEGNARKSLVERARSYLAKARFKEREKELQ